MSKHEKAVHRLLAKPSDFAWQELETLMKLFGYQLKTTKGSARRFVHRDTRATLYLHQPHPANTLKAYQVRLVLEFLKKEGHIA